MAFTGFGKAAATKRGGSALGRMIVKDDALLIPYTLKATHGTTLFRPWRDSAIENNAIVNLPERDPANGEDLLPTWFGSDAICQQTGLDTKFDCIASCRDPNNWGGSSPLFILHKALRDICKTNKQLEELIFPEYNPSSKKFPGFSLRDVGMIKGMMFQFDGGPCKESVNGRDIEKPLAPVLLILPISAAKRLYTMCATTRKDGSWVLEDVAGWANGRVLEFGFVDQLATADEMDVTKVSAAPAVGDKGPRQYGVRVRSEYDANVRMTDSNLILPFHQLNQPIPEALNVMSGEEQIEQCILPAFMQIKDIIIQVFEPYNCLPSEFVNSRTSVSMTSGGLQAPGLASVQSAPVIPGLAQSAPAPTLPGLGSPAGGLHATGAGPASIGTLRAAVAPAQAAPAAPTQSAPVIPGLTPGTSPAGLAASIVTQIGAPAQDTQLVSDLDNRLAGLNIGLGK